MSFIQPEKIAGNEYKAIYGIDEAGRGPWAGPVVACALKFKGKPVKGCDDSKKLTEKQREALYPKIIENSFYGVGVVEASEIDQLGIVKATNLAFQRAIEQLSSTAPKADFFLVDGRDKLILPKPHKTIIKGDSKVKIISAASIVAKVERDAIMRRYANEYPEYSFDKHKGYGTALHVNALKENGVCKIHRLSYKPVKEFV